MPLVTVIWEGEMGGSLEPSRSRLRLQDAIMPLDSKSGPQSKTLSEKYIYIYSQMSPPWQYIIYLQSSPIFTCMPPLLITNLLSKL